MVLRAWQGRGMDKPGRQSAGAWEPCPSPGSPSESSVVRTGKGGVCTKSLWLWGSRTSVSSFPVWTLQPTQWGLWRSGKELPSPALPLGPSEIESFPKLGLAVSLAGIFWTVFPSDPQSILSLITKFRGL